MAEHWIHAAKAKSLAGSTYALCERAEAGLVRAHAARLIMNDVTRDDVDLPAKFWWAKGHEALQQNWQSGDFSTWIDSKRHLQAFGVTFALADVLGMLPAESRSAVARSLSVTGKPEWMTAGDALRFISERLGLQAEAAVDWFIDQGRHDFLSACAVEAACIGLAKDKSHFAWTRREWVVPAWFWSEFARMPATTLNFLSGRFEAQGQGPLGERELLLTDVHFARAALIELAGGQAGSLPAGISANTGGRPRAAFAEDMLNAVWSRIYDGSLIPHKQADIQNAMLDWLTANGHSLSDSSVKKRARKVWNFTQPRAKT